MALATDCTINRRNNFARKNYFYPDLPKGYQISQYAAPLAEWGAIEIETEAGKKRIGITRIHMEEDAGKLIHDEANPVSYVDFNRTGVPLIEIVSEPDLRSAEEAVLYLRALRDILVYLEICDGNMEEGSFRCDANVSLRPRGQEAFGTRTELKNMNSFRHVQRALEYEIKRQTFVLEGGNEVVQETRLWDESQGVTYAMRGKEEAHDYRYFPEPDLVPLSIDDAWIEALKASLPELPAPKRKRFMEQYGLSSYDATILTSERPLAEYFEDCTQRCGQAKMVANWIMGDLLKLINENHVTIRDCRVTPEGLAELISLITEGTISGKIAKDILQEVFKTGHLPRQIVEKQGLVQITDAGALETIVADIIARYPEQVSQYRAGKEKVFGFFVGQVMKETQGKANPQLVNKLLREHLQT